MDAVERGEAAELAALEGEPVEVVDAVERGEAAELAALEGEPVEVVDAVERGEAARVQLLWRGSLLRLWMRWSGGGG